MMCRLAMFGDKEALLSLVNAVLSADRIIDGVIGMYVCTLDRSTCFGAFGLKGVISCVWRLLSFSFLLRYLRVFAGFCERHM